MSQLLLSFFWSGSIWSRLWLFLWLHLLRPWSSERCWYWWHSVSWWRHAAWLHISVLVWVHVCLSSSSVEWGWWSYLISMKLLENKLKVKCELINSFWHTSAIIHKLSENKNKINKQSTPSVSSALSWCSHVFSFKWGSSSAVFENYIPWNEKVTNFYVSVLIKRIAG